MLAQCLKCGRLRSTKYMQEAVFRGVTIAFDEPVDIWKCASTQSCKKARKEARNGNIP